MRFDRTDLIYRLRHTLFFCVGGARRSRGQVEVRLRRGRGEVEARSRRGRGEVEARSRRMYVKCNVSLRTLHSQNVTFH